MLCSVCHSDCEIPPLTPELQTKVNTPYGGSQTPWTPLVTSPQTVVLDSGFKYRQGSLSPSSTSLQLSQLKRVRALGLFFLGPLYFSLLFDCYVLQVVLLFGQVPGVLTFLPWTWFPPEMAQRHCRSHLKSEQTKTARGCPGLHLQLEPWASFLLPCPCPPTGPGPSTCNSAPPTPGQPTFNPQ